MTRRRAFRLAAAVGGLLVAGATWLWFAPSGTGEVRQSLDGRYTAHVQNVSAGTWTGGWDEYVEVRVVEEGSGREVWRVVRPHPAGADVPEYGSRAERFVVWAADSSSVATPVGGGQQVVLPVP